MPSAVALLLCTIFVLFMLRFDKRQAPDVSVGLWVPTIFVLYAASKPLGVWFGNVEADGSPMDRIFLLALLLIGCFLLIKRGINWSRVIHENVWVFLLLSYMFVSILWSDIPFVSLKRWTRELVGVVMALLVLTERDPARAVQSIIRREIYFCVPFSLLLIKYFPEYGIFYGRHDGMAMWVGVTLHKQGLSMLCSISAFFLVWSFIRRWGERNIVCTRNQTLGEAFILIITIWLLFAGGEGKTSAAANGSLASGLAMLACLLWMKRRGRMIGEKMLVAIIACLMGFGILTVMTGGATFGALTSLFGRDSTLTGRTEIWAAILPTAMESPILGGGFGGFWTPSIVEKLGVNECHSGYLEVILELGFVGIVLCLFFMLACCRKSVKELSHDFNWACFWICFLFMTVLHNVAESSLNTFTSPLMAVLLILSVSYASPTSRVR